MSVFQKTKTSLRHLHCVGCDAPRSTCTAYSCESHSCLRCIEWIALHWAKIHTEYFSEHEWVITEIWFLYTNDRFPQTVIELVLCCAFVALVHYPNETVLLFDQSRNIIFFFCYLFLLYILAVTIAKVNIIYF